VATTGTKPVAQLTLITGAEAFLVERALATTTRGIRRQHPDLQITVIDAAHDDVPQELMQASSPNLFGDASCVIVHNIDQLDDDADGAFRSLIASMPDEVWLIATHPGGVKGKARLDAMRAAGADVIEAPVVKKGRKMLDFLTKEVTRHKRKATNDALQALVDAIGPDIRMLAGAVDQLLADVEHDPITADDVRDAYAGVAEIAGWTISDRVWERNAQGALTDVRRSLLTSDGGRLGPSTVGALARGLRNVVLVGSSPPGAADGDVARDVGVQPWQVATLRRQWSGWNADRRRIAQAIVSLAEADGAMKGGVLAGSSLDPEQKAFALEQLVASLSARQVN
jgi:DNA polymerase III subunit delta